MPYGGKMPDYSETKEFKRVKTSLLKSLEAQGRKKDAALKDKVEEYMGFWARRRQLQADIAERGLTVTDDRGRVSENRSVSLEIQVSRQMLAILNFLGVKPPDTQGESWPPSDDEL